MTRAHKTIPSRVAIRGHPLHPMATVFPICFLSSVLLTDVVYWWTGQSFWAYASFWLSAAGVAAGIAAAFLGMVDFFTIERVRRYVTAWNHFLAGMMLLAVAGMNVGLRWGDPVEAVLPWGVFASALLALLVAVTGWLGGTLTFGHGIGGYDPADPKDTAESGDG